MTYHAQRHKTRGFVCKAKDCPYIDLDVDFQGYQSCQYDKKIYSFFVQFSNNSKLLWEGFLSYSSLQENEVKPIDDLLRQPNGELLDVTEVMGEDVGNAWNKYRIRDSRNIDDEVHLDAGNVFNFTKDDVTNYLHVTVVSLVHSIEQPEAPPELRLHYSTLFNGPRMLHFNQDLPSFDGLPIQSTTIHDREELGLIIPILLWKSPTRLHSFSLLYYSKTLEYYNEIVDNHRPVDDFD
jgi:hypothetical protein